MVGFGFQGKFLELFFEAKLLLYTLTRHFMAAIPGLDIHLKLLRFGFLDDQDYSRARDKAEKYHEAELSRGVEDTFLHDNGSS